LKLVPVLLLIMSVAAGVILVLAFQHWIDFGITELRGTDAEAATGVSDGWFVAALAATALALIGALLFRPQLSPVLLPLVALASIGILAIAGFDTITNWHASGLHPDNPGIFVQTDGDPTVVPYAIAVLAVLIAVLAAIARAIQLKADPHLLGDLVEHEGPAPGPAAGD
jgi:hypothetical protein